MSKPISRGGAAPRDPLHPEPSPPLAARALRDPAQWVAHIRDQDMPALGATVSLVHRVTEDDTASTDRLAQVILQDAAMTTKVLKLANSASYNPARHGISTISRAIVVLGFNVVAEIAIGLRLVDSLLSGGVRQRVLDEMARAFHAAVQARAIASLRRDRRSEEVFIAALLSRVGEMAFWCFGGQVAQRLDQAMQASGQTPEKTQMAVLGFRLRQISAGLAREWRLGPLLQAVLEGGARPAPVEQAIGFGHRLATELEHGWDTPAMQRLVAELSEFVGMSPEALREALAANCKEAAIMATRYGAGEAARLIPQAALAAIDEEAGPEPEESGKSDTLLQLRILRELSGHIASGASLNEILQLVLEGLYRGVGFDRVVVALLTPNRRQIVGKTGLGAGVEALRQRFVFSVDSEPGELFTEFFRSPRALRFDPERELAGISVDGLQQVTTAPAACIAPILVQGRAIGLFYADRLDAARRIDDQTFEAFQLFVQQVSLAVSTGESGARAP